MKVKHRHVHVVKGKIYIARFQVLGNGVIMAPRIEVCIDGKWHGKDLQDELPMICIKSHHDYRGSNWVQMMHPIHGIIGISKTDVILMSQTYDNCAVSEEIHEDA